MEESSMISQINTKDMAALRARHQAKSLHAKPHASEAQIAKVAEEFESVFLSQMLKHMFDGVETDELTGGGHGEDTYRSLMVDEYSKMIAKTGGIGVADHVKAEMIRMQEVGGQVPQMTLPAGQ